MKIAGGGEDFQERGPSQGISPSGGLIWWPSARRNQSRVDKGEERRSPFWAGVINGTRTECGDGGRRS